MASNLSAVQAANRMIELERRESPEPIQGTITGTVAASWIKLGEDGAGRVEYKDREYIVSTVGFTSLPKGTKVQMTYGGGVYYAIY
jgi:hypothetical protein